MGIKIKIALLLFTFMVNALPFYAQQKEIDSLLKVIPSLDDLEKVSALIDLAYAYDGAMELDLAQENATKALNLANRSNDKKSKANIFNLLATISLKRDNINSAEINADKAIQIGLEIQNPNILALGYYNLGLTNYTKSNYQVAKKNWEESLKYYQQTGDKDFSARILSLLGVIYKNWSEYHNAIEYYEKALQIYIETKNEVGMARIYGNLGNIYFNSDIDYDNALENYKKALESFRKNQLVSFEISVLLNIGMVYEKKKLKDEALNYFNQGLVLAEKNNDNSSKALALSSIGSVMLSNNNYQSALKNFNEALKIFESLESKKDIAVISKFIGELYHAWGDYPKAKEHLLESIEICKEIGLKKELSDIYMELSMVLAKLYDYENAYRYHKLYAEQKDSIFSVEYTDMMTEWNARLENEEAKRKLQDQQYENQRQQADIRRKNIIQYFMGGGILTVLIFSVLLYKQFREKKQANILLKDQNDEIKLQRDKIFEQNKEITDSIEYASKIQSAMLPPKDYISSVLPDHFVLYRPRDIVSGDFYWLNTYNNKVYFCAADCTGHGVPGAFMSMLGIALLNEIINKKGDFTAAEILNNLRSQVVKSMHQRGHEGETQDGMDIAFCVLDLQTNLIQFSGAFNPLFIIRDGELLEFKGDKMPIGVHIKQDIPFTNHEINLKTGDKLYIFSDGYVDQFGGPKRKKYLIKRFRDLLLKINNKSMAQQKVALDNEIDEWMGSYDQIDDILVFGSKIS